LSDKLNALIIGEFDRDNMANLLAKSTMIDSITSSLKINETWVNNFDLFVFTGGADITPQLYGENNRYSGIDPSRDQYDLYYLRIADKLHKKIFGVCRGHQLINAYFGGKLYQDIGSDAISHRYHNSIHPLVVRDDFPQMFVNSTHHQGVSVVGDNFIPLAFSPYGDGVVEASRRGNQIFSCQFHPEYDSSFPGPSNAPFMDYFNKFLSSNLYDYSEGA